VKHDQHTEFWRRYDAQCRAPIERACRAASRTLTDSTMDVDDMIAWTDTKVWRMLERDAYPTFHDDPSVDLAIERLTTHAPTLARWAYLALCRGHFRRINARAEYLGAMSRSERLSMVSAVDTKLQKREALDETLSALRDSLNPTERQKLAASWSDPAQRRRIALVLGATRREDDRMMTKTTGGAVKENTVEQMRSRARKRAREVIAKTRTLPAILAVGAVLGVLGLTPTHAIAGEQSGGRGGASATAPMDDPSGATPIAPPAAKAGDGEQTGR